MISFHGDAAAACGMNWSEPRAGFYEGLDSAGHVYLIEKLGEVTADKVTGKDDLTLPVYALFMSENDAVSSYGVGWRLPLLQSHFLQVDQNTFKILQPDGRTRLFWRDSKHPEILTGQGDYKAEFKGDALKVYSGCGSATLTFQRGRLVAMTIGERNLSFVWDGGDTATEIRENGETLLKVERDSSTNSVISLKLSNTEIKIGSAPRPRVQVIGGKNLIAGEVASLGKIDGPSGGTKQFEYGVDEEVRPSLKVVDAKGNERLLIWDPATREIVRDGSLSYRILKNDGEVDVTRWNKAGVKESWKSNPTKGYEIVTDISGVTRRRNWFVSGLANGKERSWSITDPSGKSETRKVAYNEAGQLLAVRDGEMWVEKREYDEQKRVKHISRLSGVTKDYEYESSAQVVTWRNNGQELFKASYDSKTGELTKIVDENGVANDVKNSVKKLLEKLDSK